eukprot:COSAG02_NODE_42848_length_380_cov_1.220641_2_plen_30_part_01
MEQNALVSTAARAQTAQYIAGHRNTAAGLV